MFAFSQPPTFSQLRKSEIFVPTTIRVRLARLLDAAGKTGRWDDMTVVALRLLLLA